MIHKCFKYKLYNSKHNNKLHKLVNLSCEVYNHCIALHKRYYKLFKKHLNVYQLQKHITKLKSLSKKHWNNLPSQSIQDITERIDNAYKKFFDYVKNKKKGIITDKVSPPKFKKFHKYKSFTLKQSACKIIDNMIIVQKRAYKYFNSRNVEGKIKTIVVKRNALREFYICITSTLEQDIQPIKSMTGKSAGFDFGLKQFLTSSDNLIPTNDLVMPQFFKDNLKKVKVLSKSVSIKRKAGKERFKIDKKVSNQYIKAKQKIARLHKKITNQREFYHHKIANLIVKTYDVLCFETLNIRGMKKLWGRKISDYGFCNFFKILENKCNNLSKKIIQIDRWYPSSKTCSNCNYINKGLNLKDRDWICTSCNTKHDRDKNAAVNILRVGTSTLSLDNVRPSLKAIIV